MAHFRAIANFVRICTSQDIPVQFTSGGDSYTDGEKVVLSGSVNDKNFDSTVGNCSSRSISYRQDRFRCSESFLQQLRYDNV